MSFEDLLKSLQRDYLASLPEKVVNIRAQIDAAAVADLRESFHKLKGTGRTYGLPDVSLLAETVEGICIHRPVEAVKACTVATGILEDIYSVHSRGEVFQLQADARFAQIRALHPA